MCFPRKSCITRNDNYTEYGRFCGTYHPWSDTVYAGGRFQPRPGDLVFFAWSEASRTAAAKDHTAIFVSDDWNNESLVIYTLDGNSDDKVQNNTRKVTNQSSGRISSGWIAGFIAPNYGDGNGMVQGKVTPPAPAKPAGTTPTETQKPSTTETQTPSTSAEEPANPKAEEDEPVKTPVEDENDPPAGDEDDPPVGTLPDENDENDDDPPGEDAAEKVEE